MRLKSSSENDTATAQKKRSPQLRYRNFQAITEEIEANCFSNKIFSLQNYAGSKMMFLECWEKQLYKISEKQVIEKMLHPKLCL